MLFYHRRSSRKKSSASATGAAAYGGGDTESRTELRWQVYKGPAHTAALTSTTVTVTVLLYQCCTGTEVRYSTRALSAWPGFASPAGVLGSLLLACSRGYIAAEVTVKLAALSGQGPAVLSLSVSVSGTITVTTTGQGLV